MVSKVYISGPMTGYPEYNRPAFAEAAQAIKARGWEPANPARDIIVKGEAAWDTYMRYAITLMMQCDGIYMLDNWQYSRGATIEYQLAMSLGFTFVRL